MVQKYGNRSVRGSVVRGSVEKEAGLQVEDRRALLDVTRLLVIWWIVLTCIVERFKDDSTVSHWFNAGQSHVQQISGR